ncbi:hypothetical protein HNQ80_002648 [Anaerosolibacter carboniphilus]|uniref:MetS family NSS transporter small subunit n=1 Tax=Anaerosolibacter carboniphilus TaxID=1417629 RepID=A0A841KSJ0_9FIRM|nr:hypothetical protein [Anaerosolibacter carboniphilus]
MSSTSIIMMVITLGFYFCGFLYLLNRAFKSQNNK